MTALWSLSSTLLKYFRDPKNVGVIKDADGIGYVGDPSRGVDMELYIKVNDGIIVDAKFRTFGCGASIATCSIITEMIKGKSIKEVLNISSQAIAEALDGLPSAKKHCTVLGQELIESSIDDYLTKRERRTDGSE